MAGLESIMIYSFSSNIEIDFHAFVTDFSDTFTSNWTPQDIYGRMDPIYTYKNTVRKITLAFDVPSSNFEEADRNNQNVDKLIKSLYPVYDVSEGKGAATLSSPPLFRLKLANLIKGSAFEGDTAADGGLLGIIDSFAFKPDVESGFLYNQPNTGAFLRRQNKFYSKLFKVNFNFMVIHEHPLGNYVGNQNIHYNRLIQEIEEPIYSYSGLSSPFPHSYDITEKKEFETTQKNTAATTKILSNLKNPTIS